MIIILLNIIIKLFELNAQLIDSTSLVDYIKLFFKKLKFWLHSVFYWYYKKSFSVFFFVRLIAQMKFYKKANFTNCNFLFFF